MRDDTVYVQHILESIKTIGRYLKGVSMNDFLKNDMLQDAVIRNMEIIGEASSQISDHFQKQHNEIPWKKVIGIRNRLIHEYFGVDKKIVWDSCKIDLAYLKKVLKTLR